MKHLKANGKLWDFGRHLLQLVEAKPGARAWRKNLTLKAQTKNADLQILEEAAKQLEESGL